MTTNVKTKPMFNQNQLVGFIGGVGRILSCRVESGTWTYIVEMELDSKLARSRIGSETTVLLHEIDILAVST